MSELDVKLTGTSTIFCDNIGASYLCANMVFHSCMKHIVLDDHFIREQIQNKELRVSHISFVDQLADTLTKPLPRARFQDLSIKNGVSSDTPS